VSDHALLFFSLVWSHNLGGGRAYAGGKPGFSTACLFAVAAKRLRWTGREGKDRKERKKKHVLFLARGKERGKNAIKAKLKEIFPELYLRKSAVEKRSKPQREKREFMYYQRLKETSIKENLADPEFLGTGLFNTVVIKRIMRKERGKGLWVNQRTSSSISCRLFIYLKSLRGN